MQEKLVGKLDLRAEEAEWYGGSLPKRLQTTEKVRSVFGASDTGSGTGPGGSDVSMLKRSGHETRRREERRREEASSGSSATSPATRTGSGSRP